MGQVGEPECDQQHVDHEQLGRAAPGDQVEPAAEQFLAEEEHRHQGHDRLEQGPGERPGQFSRRLRQRGDEDQQRNHRQVLEQQHAHDLPAVRRIELHAFGQQLGQDRGRGHGNRPAERQRRCPGQVRQHGQRQHQRGGHEDLREPQPEDDALHAVQARQRELEADREHQEHHAELGQVARSLGVRDQVQGVRTQRRPDQDVAEHRRQVERAEPADHQDGGGEQQQDNLQRLNHSLRGRGWMGRFGILFLIA